MSTPKTKAKARARKKAPAPRRPRATVEDYTRAEQHLIETLLDLATLSGFPAPVPLNALTSALFTVLLRTAAGAGTTPGQVKALQAGALRTGGLLVALSKSDPARWRDMVLAAGARKV